jgi:hypothetical protein
MSDTKKMRYDSELIVCLVPGGRNANKGNLIAYMNAEALEAKRKLAKKVAGETATTKLVKAEASGTPDLSAHKSSIKDNTRVYLVGHGTAESSSLGGLNATNLATMVKTLVGPGKRIKRLGLVGCFSGQSELPASERPLHRLAAELFEMVNDSVDEITGYTGEVGTKWAIYDGLGENTIRTTRTNVQGHQEQVYAGPGTGGKVVDNGGVRRKVIVTARGSWWAEDYPY